MVRHQGEMSHLPTTTRRQHIEAGNHLPTDLRLDERTETVSGIEIAFAQQEVFALQDCKLGRRRGDFAKIVVNLPHAKDSFVRQRTRAADRNEVRTIEDFPMRETKMPSLSRVRHRAEAGDAASHGQSVKEDAGRLPALREGRDPRYSLRSAVIGFTPTARRAGTKHATSVAATSRTDATPSTIGSHGFTS